MYSEISLLHRTWEERGGRLCFGDSINCHAPQEADPGEAGIPIWFGAQQRKGVNQDTEEDSAGSRALEPSSISSFPSALER